MLAALVLAPIVFGVGRFDWLPMLLLCAAVVGVSIVGDLTESLFKRHRGVKDSGIGQLTAVAVVRVNLVDVNENPRLPTLPSFTLDENVAGGTIVGTVVGTDPDSRDAGAPGRPAAPRLRRLARRWLRSRRLPCGP